MGGGGVQKELVKQLSFVVVAICTEKLHIY